MRTETLEQRLRESVLVDDVSVRKAAGGRQGCYADIRLSAKGHLLARDEGRDALTVRLRQLVSQDETRLANLRLAIVADFPDVPGAEAARLPPVLSVLEDSQHIRMLLEIRPELEWFRGHFPGRPVLPGIVQVHWAVLLATARFGLHSAPAEIKRLKFKNVVVPPAILELSITPSKPGEVAFAWTGSGQLCSEGQLVAGGAVQ